MPLSDHTNGTSICTSTINKTEISINPLESPHEPNQGIFVCAVFLAGVFVLGLWIPASGNAAIVVFTVVFGFVSGAYVSLPSALVMGISPLDEIGYRTGLLILFSSVGG